MRKKLFFSYLLLFISVTLCVTFFCINSGHKFYFKQLKEELVISCKMVSKSMQTSNNWQANVQELGKLIDTRITIVDIKGNVVAESYSNKDLMDNHLNRDEIQEALKHGTGFSQRKSDTTKTNWLYTAVRVNNNYFNGFVRCAIPLDEIKDINNTYIKYGIIGIVIGIIVGSIIAYFFSKRLSHPIEVLTEAADKISEGNLNINVKLNGDIKFQILADAFNNMSSRLKETLETLGRKNTQMESILNSMVNGMIAVDKNNIVVMVNKVLFKQLGISETEISGHYLEEKIRVMDLINSVDKVKKTKKTIEQEFKIYMENEEKIFLAKCSPIFNADKDKEFFGVLIIIQDITYFRKLEQVRSEFVSNVTHELKTPLTSIKGFIEILTSDEELDYNTQKKFLDIIDIESDRLYFLIQDLLTLSEIENDKKVEYEYIDVSKILDEVTTIMKHHANKKNLDLNSIIDKDFPKVIANEHRIKQMLINLIDNAIKYTDKGKVIVKCYYDSYYWYVSVKDTGIGISKEHMSRLFERFYRVDKGRSRKMGGTGLGLSIVKHIVLLHDGTIKVDSELGKGTEFIITFPRKTTA